MPYKHQVKSDKGAKMRRVIIKINEELRAEFEQVIELLQIPVRNEDGQEVIIFNKDACPNTIQYIFSRFSKEITFKY